MRVAIQHLLVEIPISDGDCVLFQLFFSYVSFFSFVLFENNELQTFCNKPVFISFLLFYFLLYCLVAVFVLVFGIIFLILVVAAVVAVVVALLSLSMS